VSSKISVIVSNYNYAPYVSEAIESVLRQTYQNYEIIIVDDGSTDNSREIITSYVDKYPGKIIPVFKENGGQGSAFNYGFSLATGDIIAFLDADDYWYENKLEMITHYHKVYNGIQHNLLVNNDKKFANLEDKVCKQKRQLEDFCMLGTIPTSGLSFVTSSMNRIFPIPEKEYRVCADSYIRNLYLDEEDMFSLNEPLGCYRAHNSNVWFNNKSISTEYDMTTVRLLNERKALRGEPLIEYVSATCSTARFCVDSYKLKKGQQYIIAGTGSLGNEMYNLMKQEHHVVAFTNSFVKKQEVHQDIPLIPFNTIESEYPEAIILLATTFVEEVYDELKKHIIKKDKILIPNGV